MQPLNPKQDPEELVISGVIQRVTFRNPENGYSVIQLKLPNQNDNVTVVGNCASANTGANLVVRGHYIQHPKFGKQFNAKSITETAPSTPEGIKIYLSSGIVPGIGEKTAERLVKVFGQDTLEVIFKEPERLAKIPGVGKHKAALISETFSKNSQISTVLQFLLENNISPRLASKIQQLYQNRSIEILKRDPYILARDIKGVGFTTADSIALRLGLKLDSPQRLKAGIYHSLEKASEDGHCFLPAGNLSDKARVLLQVNDEIDLQPFVDQLAKEDYIIIDDQDIYLNSLYRAEKFVADFIAQRRSALRAPIIKLEQVEKNLALTSKDLGITFSFEQRQAVIEACQQQLLIITGGPGCGKTTIIKALANTFKFSGKRLLLAAPTGRAAQRMSQVTDEPASTIHRLLKFDPIRGRFLYGPNEPLPVDILIIDEASMIDINLAKDLFSAIPKNATLILVGDRDQLPSVGPGRVFGDLIAANCVKVIALSQLFRRSGESSINDIAHSINAGLMPQIPQPDGNTKVDAYFIARTEAEEAAKLIESLVAEQLPNKFNLKESEICVLTPTNRGPLGTVELNKRLQARLNPVSSSDAVLTVGQMEFRISDRVCQRVNNYQIDDLGVFNGDMGQIYSIDQQTKSLVVEMWDGRLIQYETNDLQQLSLAYAITVHRSQGSEIPCVILALHDSHYVLLERQLIYTGITRAKKLLVVVGSKRALSIACKKTSSKKRCCKLSVRINDILKQNDARN